MEYDETWREHELIEWRNFSVFLVYTKNQEEEESFYQGMG